jgi:hypothetical protein
MTATSVDREALRAQRKLRLVNGMETGSAAEDCPGGVYGFTCSPNTEGAPVFPTHPFQSFEVHKLSDRSVHLVGFMSEEDARALDSASEPVEVKLYPEPFGEAQKMVSVPRERIYRPRPSSREQGNWMPFVLAPK